MVKRIVVLAVALVALMAAPAAAQQYPPDENIITVSDTSPCPGQTVTVTAQAFFAGSTVDFRLNGQDPAVAHGTADANGKVTVELTIPAGQAQGPLEIKAQGSEFGNERGYLELNAAVDVAACNETPPTTAPGGGGGGGGGSDLPKTGSDTTMTLVRVGVALAAVGGLLLAVSTKRRRRTGPAPA